MDHVFITHEHLKFVQNFKVIINDRCRFPDHNILCVTVSMSYCIDVSHVNKGSDDLDLDVNSMNYPERKTDYKTKMIKYKYENMPKTFMNNEKCINNAKDCHSIINNSSDINAAYVFLLYMLNDEMNTHLEKRGSGNKCRKKYNGTSN